MAEAVLPYGAMVADQKGFGRPAVLSHALHALHEVVVAIRLVDEALAGAAYGDDAGLAAVDEVRERALGAVRARHEAGRSPGTRVRIVHLRLRANLFGKPKSVAGVSRARRGDVLALGRGMVIDRLAPRDVLREAPAGEGDAFPRNDPSRPLGREDLGPGHLALRVADKSLDRAVEPDRHAQVLSRAIEPRRQGIAVGEEHRPPLKRLVD